MLLLSAVAARMEPANTIAIKSAVVSRTCMVRKVTADYFVYIRRVAEGGGSAPGGAASSWTVSHVFQPCGRFWASNSP
jgi:hypothetical protein